MKDSLYTALQECIRKVNQGASVRECLDRYPDHADDLEPLLQSVARTPQQEEVAMPSQWDGGSAGA